METLPTWFWVCYYIFIFVTLISGIINWIKQVHTPMAAMIIILSLLTPLVGFVYSVGRTEGLNEFQYILQQIKGGNLWAIFISAAHLYFAVWWFIFLDIWKWVSRIPFSQIKEILINRFKKKEKEKEKEREEA